MSNRQNRVLKGFKNDIYALKSRKSFDSPDKTRLRQNKKVNVCAYCGDRVPNGTGIYTDDKGLLICQRCKPRLFTPLERVTETVKRLPSVRMNSVA